MLEGHVSGDDAKWRLQTIRDQISRISGIIQDAAQHGAAAEDAPQPVPVALGPLIDTTLSFVSEKLARRQIEVEKDIRSAPSVIGDSERLQQLLLNLVLNAADAMPEGGTLRVDLAEGETGDAEVRIADTGSGGRSP